MQEMLAVDQQQGNKTKTIPNGFQEEDLAL